MTKDEFYTYVKAVLDMEVEIARITNKTKIDNIELVGALKLIKDALDKVDKIKSTGAPVYPFTPSQYPISPEDWVITYGVSNSEEIKGEDGRKIWTTNTSNT